MVNEVGNESHVIIVCEGFHGSVKVAMTKSYDHKLLVCKMT